MVVSITDAEFNEKVLNSSVPVIIDFWAEWCGPCKQLTPTLDELAKEFAEKVTIAKVNIDENPEAPSKYGVRGIPTLILFKDGKQISVKVGALPKTALAEWIKSNI